MWTYYAFARSALGGLPAKDAFGPTPRSVKGQTKGRDEAEEPRAKAR